MIDLNRHPLPLPSDPPPPTLHAPPHLCLSLRLLSASPLLFPVLIAPVGCGAGDYYSTTANTPTPPANGWQVINGAGLAPQVTML
eukprot:SAG25_NODE_1497_length_2899_cov_1.736786_3_plen_85_part_00